MLWIRPLDSVEARQLAGTEGAYFPFWSPDSRSIAFPTLTDKKLKKVDISGGPPLTLASIQGSQSGAWNADGVILFNPDFGPLYSVPAAGGEPKPLLDLDRSRKEISQGFPRFLPGGRDFVYLSRSQEAAQTGIYLGSLDSKETRRLVSASSNPSFVLPGFLLFARERTLFAQVFDPAKRQPAGEAFPIAESVGGAGATFGNTYSASESGALAFQTAGAAAKELVWYERSGKRLGPIGEARDYLQFTIAPGNRRLAIQVRDPQAGRTVYWQLDLASGILSRLTSGLNGEDSAVWSPDGSEIIFGSRRSGQIDLFRKMVGGGEEREILSSNENKFPEQWLRDGSLLFINSQGKTFYRLALQKDAKPEVLLKTDYAKDAPRVSPDGRWISYNTDESGRWEVYIASFPSFQNRRQVSSSGGVQGVWNKDGKELYYLSLDGVLMSVAVKPGPPLDTGIPQTLFPTRIAVSATADQYGVFDGGRKFLVIEPVETQAQPITVVLNWPTGVKK
jgi:Tol biopolymer transport system component